MLVLAKLANAEGEVEMATVGGMAQVNVRVDRQVKNRAEEALQLSGRSLPELIKKVVVKSHRVAGSVRKCCLPLMVGNKPSRTILRSPHHGRRRISFTRTWASLRRPYPTIAVGTQSIPKPWTSAIAKRG